MAETKPSIASLFGGIGSDQQLQRATLAQDIGLGKELAGIAPERVGMFFAPQAVTAAGRAGRLFGGQDTRTQAEIEGAGNRELFTRLSQEAERLFPNDRTKQLLHLANKLSAEGKVVESQKARALAQESAKTAAETRKATAQAVKAETEAVKLGREANLQGIGNVKPENYTSESLEAFRQSIAAGKPNFDLLDVRPEVDATTYQKELLAAYPNDPVKRGELFKQYIEEKTQRGGLPVELDATEQKWVMNNNLEGIKEYQVSAKGATRTAEAVDALMPTVYGAITGAGSDLKQFVQSLTEQLGIKMDFGNLTDTQLIDQFLSQNILGQAQLMKGALSDNDIRFLKATVASLGSTPEAIRVALAQLKNRKLTAQKVAERAKQTFGETRRTQKTLTIDDALDFETLESTVAGEMNLVNPRLLGGRWMLTDGTVDPQMALKATEEEMNRATPEARAALVQFLQGQR